LERLKAVYHSLPFLPKRRRKQGPLYHFEEPTLEEAQQIHRNIWEVVNLDENVHTHLRRAAYHFLYTTKIGLPELRIFRDPQRPGTYFFSAGVKITRVRFTLEENNI